jgi:hypothetical protein
MKRLKKVSNNGINITPLLLIFFSYINNFLISNYLITNGYSLQLSFSTNLTTLYLSDAPMTIRKFDKLRRTSINGKYSLGVQFATTDKAYYMDIFTYVSGNGFVATKQDKLEIIDGMLTTRYFFENETYTYTLYTFTTTDNVVFFNVQVFKNFGK